MGCYLSLLERIVSEKFDESEIVMKNVGWASLDVLTTQGCCSLTGNGALVLTREKLWFRFLCCGDDELDIPLTNVTKAYVTRTLSVPGFYRSGSSPMLVIEFAGQLVAFTVSQEDIWLQKIGETQSRNKDHQQVFAKNFGL